MRRGDWKEEDRSRTINHEGREELAARFKNGGRGAIDWAGAVRARGRLPDRTLNPSLPFGGRPLKRYGLLDGLDLTMLVDLCTISLVALE